MAASRREGGCQPGPAEFGDDDRVQFRPAPHDDRRRQLDDECVGDAPPAAAGLARLWVLDLTHAGPPTLLTFGGSSYYDPRWGPDAAWVAASRPAPPPLDIVRIEADGREALLSTPGEHPCILDEVATDGRYLLCRSGGGLRLVAFPVEDGSEPILVRDARVGYIDQAQFSPDSRWIAYNANESGRLEVYVTAFPQAGERWPLSMEGGVQPAWRQDGRELYYLGLDGSLNAVEFRTGERPQYSAPTRLLI